MRLKVAIVIKRKWIKLNLLRLKKIRLTVPTPKTHQTFLSSHILFAINAIIAVILSLSSLNFIHTLGAIHLSPQPQQVPEIYGREE